ncbi:recombinase family protein [Streptomyces sp. MZ04]|uniref:recombinase family protein n=1 Tax=Streptomyces sp. MZ04 TaxID=2559236 RepID=UPI00107EB2A9|nr:recombinase family protein [Streptomyces sp. MZ04]TGB12614.1 hypothetical protein E2651_11560 [Streptomyces sp. MZ04]
MANTTRTVTGSGIAPPAVLTGREYLRVSEDDSREARSVTEQHAENGEAAEGHGITLGTPYADNGKSASRYATKVRDDFQRLVSDLEQDLFGAEVLVIWENSRGSRKVSEWALLIELLEAKGVRVLVTCDDRLYDPARAADRKVLQSAAIDSEQESLKTSLRNRRTATAQARIGRPNGPCPHGYRPVYDEKSGDLINWFENLDESMVPIELFRRLRAGHALKRIARDFEKLGYLNRSGRPFTDTHLRSMAMRPAYGGYRVHAPKSRGRTYQAQQVEAELTRATWDALVDEETFWVVRRMLTAPERRTTRNGRAKHVLTMTMRCDVCSGPISAVGGNYTCRDHSCLSISKTKVDELIIGDAGHPGVILAYVASQRVYADFAATPDKTTEAEQIRAELARLRADRDEMEAAEAQTLAEVRLLAANVTKLEQKITRLEERERQLTMPAVLADLIKPGTDVAARWQAAPVSARREVARLLLAPGVLGQVRITRGRGLSADERTQWVEAA